MCLGGDISLPPLICPGIYVNTGIFGLGRKVFVMAFQCQYIQDDPIRTQGSGGF
jgi:hypothetical protein